jgi:hypothetical protein
VAGVIPQSECTHLVAGGLTICHYLLTKCRNAVLIFAFYYLSEQKTTSNLDGGRR